MIKLSVVLATRNEEENIGRCLEAVKDIADEIIVVDENSTDRTREIAESFGAKVYLEPHHEIFHITKQKAMDLASGEWILQLDADEVVSNELVQDIKKLKRQQDIKILRYLDIDERKRKLFERHQALIEKRDGPIGRKNGEIVAFFLPRRNIFLGKPLWYGGVYPDGVIRLIKKGKAYLPCKSVHEQMIIEGAVSWLSGDLIHYSDPTLRRYWQKAGQYTDLQKDEILKQYPKNNFKIAIDYLVIQPIFTFVNIFICCKGLLDGFQGFLWALFSASHYPIAYIKYLKIL